MDIKLLKRSIILEAVRRLTQKRKEEIYLVGGAVRDFFLRRPLGKDFDFVTQGNAEGLAKEIPREVGGHAFSEMPPFRLLKLRYKPWPQKFRT